MSREAEVSVLSAAFASDRHADLVVDLCTRQQFSKDAHRAVFDAITQLRTTGTTVDYVSMIDALDGGDRLDQIGGPDALVRLSNFAPDSLAVEHWAGIIRKTAKVRQLSSTLDRLRAEVADCDDPDGLVEDAVADLIETGSRPGTIDTEGLLAAFDKRVTSGSPLAGWRFPWPSMQFFRLPDDGLTVWTGLPGSGKSTLIDVTVVEWLQAHADMRVAFFSPEMAPADNHLHELVRTAMGCEPQRDPTKAREWADWFTGRCHWIDDDRDSTPSAVIAQARRLVRDHGVRLLVVDPYNNLEPDRDVKHDRQDLYIQALLRRLRRFARSQGVAVVVVAHPRKTEKVAHTDAVYRIPTAGDISGGQEWWNHADAIVSVWRNQSGEETQKFGMPGDVKVVVSKCRFAKWGATGKGQLRFVVDKRRYFDA